jgi:hypothetical protein
MKKPAQAGFFFGASVERYGAAIEAVITPPPGVA